MASAVALIELQTGHALILITLIAAPVAAIAFAASGPAWRAIGKGRFAINEQPPTAASPRRSPEEALREEVRQLVVSRNERRARNGEDPLDVEAETERQLADL